MVWSHQDSWGRTWVQLLSQLGGVQSLPKGGGGVDHAWAGKWGQRGLQHTWPPGSQSPPAQIQSGVEAVIGGSGPSLHPFSLTSQEAGKEG